MPFPNMKYLKKSLRAENRKQKALSKPQRKEVAKISKSVSLSTSELKYIDITDSISISYTWAFQHLCKPIREDGDAGERNGDEIIQRSIKYNWTAVGADTTNVIRVLIVRWLGKGDPAVTDIVSDNTTVYAPLSVYKHDQRRLFNVMYDSKPRALSVGANGIPNISGSSQIGLSNYKQQFDGGTTNNIKGGLYILYCSDSIASTHPSLTFRARTYYKDP